MNAHFLAALLVVVPVHSLRERASYQDHPGCTPNDESFYRNDTDCPPSAITNCHGGHHGFGNQYSLLVSQYIFARQRGLPFCPTRWASMAPKNTNASSMYDFVGGPHYGPPAALGTVADWLTRAGLQNAKKYIDEVRSMYLSTRKPDVHFDGGGKAVAWHWRRGDSRRLTTDQQVIDGLGALKTAFASKLKVVNFFSDAEPAEFERILKACKEEPLRIKCKLQLGGDLQVAFHHMVMADMLVQARGSTLSAIAGALNRGRVFMDLSLASGRVVAAGLEERLAVWQDAFELMME